MRRNGWKPFTITVLGKWHKAHGLEVSYRNNRDGTRAALGIEEFKQKFRREKAR